MKWIIIIYVYLVTMCAIGKSDNASEQTTTTRIPYRLRFNRQSTTLSTPTSTATTTATATPIATSTVSTFLTRHQHTITSIYEPENALPKIGSKESDAINSDVKSLFLPSSNLAVTTNSRSCGERLGEDHPWIAVIEHTNPITGISGGRKTLSKGVLIGERHVLTTVASIHNHRPFWEVSGVRLGDYPTWGTQESQKNWSSVVRAGVHEVFLHKTKDIAIIKLNRSIDISESSAIRPICLPTLADTNYKYPELFLHVCKRPAHWYENAQIPKVHMQTVQLAQDCAIMFRRRNAVFTADEFCAWDERGDTCTGDLGGPLIGMRNGRYHLIGLSSYANAKGVIDDVTLPGVFTRVESHLNWIRAVMEIGS